jgi:hypothetical protein
LYRASRDRVGVAATCLLAAFGHRPDKSDEREAEAYAGILLLLDALIELRNIRKALTTTS